MKLEWLIEVGKISLQLERLFEVVKLNRNWKDNAAIIFDVTFPS